MELAMLEVAAALACSLCVGSLVNAQESPARPSEANAPSAEARFAAPVRVMAGGKPMGSERLYPSPVFHDMNGDGLADVVIGDLWGRITVAPRLPGDEPAWGEEKPLEGADGEELKFSNW